MASKVAIVTGSNKGIGFGIVKELCKRGVGDVYLTSRDIGRGRKAVEELEKLNLHPKFHQLDVTDENSVRTFADYIKKNHGGLDILINNAGLLDPEYYKTTYEDAKQVIDINYYGILTMQKYFFPLLNENARVINMSSDWGHIINIKNPHWVQRLIKEDITLEDVNAFVNWFLDSVKNQKLKVEDFIEDTVIAYRVSKVAVSALTRVQQKAVGRNISVNCLNPGFVRTDMTKTAGELSIDEAGSAPAYLALDIDQSAKGKYFWFDKSEVDWANTSLELLNVSFDHFKQAVDEATGNQNAF